MIYDAIMTLAEALKQIGSEHLGDSITRINCYDTESTWSKGYTINNFMRNVTFEHFYYSERKSKIVVFHRVITPD